MRTNRVSFIAGTVALCHASPALASGNPAVLLIPAGHLVLAVAFLVSLSNWPTWRQRLFLSLCFVAGLVAAYLLASNVPFSANSHWLIPVMLAVPLLSWRLAVLRLRARARARSARVA